MKAKQEINIGFILLTIFVILVAIFLIVPSFMAIPMSVSDSRYLVFPPEGFTLHWYKDFLQDKMWIGATLLTLKVASITTVVSLLCGIMASLSLVKGVLPGKKILNILFISPIMIPVIVIAFTVYSMYAKLGLTGTTFGLVIAHTIYTIPFVILIISANLYRFDTSLELASRNLGANALKTYLYITFPIIKPGIISAGIFCFTMSMDELVIAMFLVGTRKVTLPMMMYAQLKYRLDPVVATASTIFIVLSIGVVIGLSYLNRRRNR